jgi:hypothetical protein
MNGDQKLKEEYRERIEKTVSSGAGSGNLKNKARSAYNLG